MICIPLKTWMTWTDEEKSQVLRYYETIGKKWYIDFTETETKRLKDLQKDKDEYREDMSTGGKPFKE